MNLIDLLGEKDKLEHWKLEKKQTIAVSWHLS